MKVESGAEETPEDAEATPATAAAAAAAPGALLRGLREARGLELEDLAQELNLSRRVLLALEADEYEQLPGPTFVRGYIRSCARQLGADPAPLLAAFETRGGRIEPMVRPTPRVEGAGLDADLVQRRPGLVMAGASVIILAFAALALLFWPRLDDGARMLAEADREAPVAMLSERSVPTSASDAAADTRMDGADAVEEVFIGFDVGDEGAPDSADAAGDTLGAAVGAFADGRQPASAAGSIDLAEPGATTADAMPATQRGADGALQVVAGGDDHLHFDFIDDCWVEVRDADDIAIYMDLNRAGQALDLWGRAPFRIRLGYAPAVELAYNDVRVPLAPHTRNDVANLVIGR